MKLADVVKAIRDEARSGPQGDESRTEWQNRLVGFGMRLVMKGRLLREVARIWLFGVARDVTADILKPAGKMPRVAAGQIAIWPEMAAVAGRNALKAYASKYRNVVNRYALCIRLLGYLSVGFGEDDLSLSQQESLLSALVAAGATAEDIANLREIAQVKAAA